MKKVKIIKITVKPGSKQSRIQSQLNGDLKIWVKSPAKQGKANKEVIELLAKYLHISKGCIVIKRGIYSRNKTILINCVN